MFAASIHALSRGTGFTMQFVEDEPLGVVANSPYSSQAVTYVLDC